MLAKHVLMYQCEFCHKMQRNKKKAIEHERGCIRNPQRECGMCRRDERTQVPRETLIQFLADTGMDEEQFRKVSGGCPMCMLSAVYAINESEGYGFRSYERFYFDYRKELEIHDNSPQPVIEGDIAF